MRILNNCVLTGFVAVSLVCCTTTGLHSADALMDTRPGDDATAEAQDTVEQALPQSAPAASPPPASELPSRTGEPPEGDDEVQANDDDFCPGFLELSRETGAPDAYCEYTPHGYRTGFMLSSGQRAVSTHEHYRNGLPRYSEEDWNEDGRIDRIMDRRDIRRQIVLEDTNYDGRMDQRTVTEFRDEKRYWRQCRLDENEVEYDCASGVESNVNL